MTQPELLYGVAAAAANVIGAVAVASRTTWTLRALDALLSFAAGFLISVSVIDLFPESIAVAGPIAPVVVLLAYLLVHLTQHTIGRHFHFGEETHSGALLEPAAAYLAIIGLGVHTVFDGVAIAAGFMVARVLGVLLFFAVLLHKVPEGFTVASIVLASGRSRGAALLAGCALGLLTFVGAVATSLLAGPHVGYALALSAGVTIYVAASDLIPEVNREGGPALAWTVFGGLVLFACADWALARFGLE